MKVCTITCHDVYNHGASLQAYALMHYLESINCSVEIIDYKPDYLSNHYNFFAVDSINWKKNITLKLIYIALKFPIRLWGIQRKNAFDRFKRENLKLTPIRYSSFDELKANPPMADVYICGSDQIWNTLHKNGKDPSFYLGFSPVGRVRIAYAASLATDKIYDGYEGFIKSNVDNINYIGIRERSGVELLKSIGINNAQHVMDPAFLLSKEQWNKVSKGDFNESYVLVYDFDSDVLVKKLALKIAREKGYKIYTVNPGKFDFADRRFDFVGPDTFISLIRDAKVVISNSFHAVVFSLIFNTDFYITMRKEAINIRMSDLLDSLSMKDRLVFDVDAIDLDTPKTFNEKKLSYLTQLSKDFLNKSISSG